MSTVIWVVVAFLMVWAFRWFVLFRPQSRANARRTAEHWNDPAWAASMKSWAAQYPNQQATDAELSAALRAGGEWTGAAQALKMVRQMERSRRVDGG